MSQNYGPKNILWLIPFCRSLKSFSPLFLSKTHFDFSSLSHKVQFRTSSSTFSSPIVVLPVILVFLYFGGLPLFSKTWVLNLIFSKRHSNLNSSFTLPRSNGEQHIIFMDSYFSSKVKSTWNLHVKLCYSQNLYQLNNKTSCSALVSQDLAPPLNVILCADFNFTVEIKLCINIFIFRRSRLRNELEAWNPAYLRSESIMLFLKNKYSL